MNLQNKILFIALLALETIFGGCNSLIFDNMKDCPQGVYLKFYSMTPCAADSTFIGEVSQLDVLAFNENGVLEATLSQKNVTLSKDYQVLMPVSNGNYTFIAWAGINEHFDVASLKEGTTTMKEVMLTLKSVNNQAAALGKTTLWQGTSAVVSLPDPAEAGSIYKYIALNLREVTNRVNVEVELHESIRNTASPKDFAIEISSANATMHIDGSMPRNGKVLNYTATTTYTAGSVKSAFSLMDLKTGYNSQITIRNIKTNKIVWQDDLIESILLKNKDINLNCQHDFDVKFVIKDKCSDCEIYICWAIFVNNWQVHSYETDL